jgi:hypothetical protein
VIASRLVPSPPRSLMMPHDNLLSRTLLWFLGSCLFAFSTEAAEPSVQTQDRETRPLVLAHYMPWYVAKPSSDQWGSHWTMNHFDPEKLTGAKREIASKYYPLIGPYDSGDPHVLEYHLLLMKLSGIDGVIVDWYGQKNYRDYAILHRNTTRVLQQCERLKMKFVICYEDQTIPALVEANHITAANRVAHATQEIQWLNKYWFQSGSYVRLEGKPVLLSFGHAGLTSDEWSQCLKTLEFPVAYFSQDFRREGAIGGFGWPAPRVGISQVDRFLKECSLWPQAIPAAFPRFDDIYREAGSGSGYPRIPDDKGKTLQTTFHKALRSQPAIIQLATWNDWGEGTQIEPSVEFGYRDLEFLQQAQSRPGASVDDLRIPLRILKARQLIPPQTAELDHVVELIISGELSSAKNALKELK